MEEYKMTFSFSQTRKPRMLPKKGNNGTELAAMEDALIPTNNRKVTCEKFYQIFWRNFDKRQKG